METTFVRLESLTYFSLTPNTYYLTPIPLFGSGYAELGFSETNLEYNFSFFLCVVASWRETLFLISARRNLAGILTKLLAKCRISLLMITFSILPSPIDFHQPSPPLIRYLERRYLRAVRLLLLRGNRVPGIINRDHP